MEEYVGILFFKEYCLDNKISIYKPQNTVVGEKFIENDFVGIKNNQEKYFKFKGDNDIICEILMKKEDIEKNYSDLKTFEEKRKAFFDNYKNTFAMTTVVENQNYIKILDISSLMEIIINNDFCIIEESVIELWKENMDKGNFEEVKETLTPIYNKIQILSNNENKIAIDSVDILNNYNTAIEKLNSLIGLENIKKEVFAWIKYLEFYEKVFEQTNLENPNLNMVFYGNPGTGKTTVARILTDILFGLNFIDNPILVEVTTSDFISNHVGETALKTKKLLDDFKGCLIFIDEAYAFNLENNKFASEALVEILKEMEKGDSVFILAGYKNEMKEFIDMNPGLESRIGNYLQFNDFSIDELMKIWEYKLNKHGFKQTEKVNQIIKNMLFEASKDKNYGNARYIDKIFDKAIFKHAINCEGIDDIEKLITLKSDDFDNINEQIKYKEKVKRIGF